MHMDRLSVYIDLKMKGHKRCLGRHWQKKKTEADQVHIRGYIRTNLKERRAMKCNYFSTLIALVYSNPAALFQMNRSLQVKKEHGMVLLSGRKSR